MPVTPNATVPESAKLLELSNEPKAKLFLCFISSIDPVSKLSWCPDVRAALPVIEKAFPAGGLEVALVEVGMRPEWKLSNNFFRTNWNVHNVPTLVRYERVDGEVKEIGRLVEEELLDEKKLHDLITN